MTPYELLKKYWHYYSFRPLQEEIVNHVLSGKDTLAILPTGGGKSVCFQIPALSNPGLCVVVTPLIALMKDQVENLEKKGIPTLYIHSGMNFQQVKKTFEKAMAGECKFLYVSPERLETSLFREFLPFLKIDLIAVDEAHCISQWGYDFRPSYLKIGSIRDSLNNVPVIALTASATLQVQKDICDKLKFKEGSRIFARPYAREALSYSVFQPPSKENKLIEILSKVPGSAIVYCRSRKRTKEISALLRLNNIDADFYHAGLQADERRVKQDKWINNQTRVICCTNAFGMGIDKPDVRLVVHFDMPEAIEYYYQEAGRAGRDGKKAYAVLLYHQTEISDLKIRVAIRFPENNEIRNVFSALCNYLELPANKGKNQSFDFEIGDFVEKFKLNALLVASVLKILEQEGYFVLSDAFFTQSTVEFLSSRNTLTEFESHYPGFSILIKGLLRSYEGILNHKCPVDEFTLARFLRIDNQEVRSSLAELGRRKIIVYEPRSDLPKLFFLTNRPEVDGLVINRRNILERKAAYEKRLEAMIQYTVGHSACRSVFINNYFGGSAILPCGICDVCLDKKKKGVSKDELKTITDCIRGSNGITVNELNRLTKTPVERLVSVIEYLKDEKLIVVDPEGNIRQKG